MRALGSNTRGVREKYEYRFADEPDTRHKQFAIKIDKEHYLDRPTKLLA